MSRPRAGTRVNSNEPYLRRVSEAHVETSAAALSELSELISAPGSAPPDRTLGVRLGHLDHGGFLSHLLHGFAMTKVTPDGLATGGDDGANDVMYAVILNQTLEVQIRTALSSIASYLGRQDVIRHVRAREQGVSNIDIAVADIDAQIVTAPRRQSAVVHPCLKAPSLSSARRPQGAGDVNEMMRPLVHHIAGHPVHTHLEALAAASPRPFVARYGVDSYRQRRSSRRNLSSDHVGGCAVVLTISRELITAHCGQHGLVLAENSLDSLVVQPEHVPHVTCVLQG
jgi:hypothetical protein